MPRAESRRSKPDSIRTKADPNSRKGATLRYRLPTKSFVDVISRDERIKGVPAPNPKIIRFATVTRKFPGIIAKSITDKKIGMAHGAAMSVYTRPNTNVPRNPLTSKSLWGGRSLVKALLIWVSMLTPKKMMKPPNTMRRSAPCFSKG